MRRAVFAVIGLGLAAIVVLGLTQSKGGGAKPRSAAPTSAATRRALAGAPAPLAALHAQANQLLDGSPADVKRRLAGLRGHPVVVNGWASWCGPCRGEFPYFQRSSVRFGRRVAFVGLDTGDNAGDAKAFTKEFPVSYPSYQDPGFRAATALRAPKGLPFTLYVTPAGKIDYVHQGGYRSQADLDADIRRHALDG